MKLFVALLFWLTLVFSTVQAQDAPPSVVLLPQNPREESTIFETIQRRSNDLYTPEGMVVNATYLSLMGNLVSAPLWILLSETDGERSTFSTGSVVMISAVSALGVASTSGTLHAFRQADFPPQFRVDDFVPVTMGTMVGTVPGIFVYQGLVKAGMDPLYAITGVSVTQALSAMAAVYVTRARRR